MLLLSISSKYQIRFIMLFIPLALQNFSKSVLRKKLKDKLSQERGVTTNTASGKLAKSGSVTKSKKSLTNTSTRSRLTELSTSTLSPTAKWGALPKDGIASRLTRHRSKPHDVSTVVYNVNTFSSMLAKHARLTALTCFYINAVSVYSTQLPKSFHQAAHSADSTKWLQAVADEFSAHAKMVTWNPTPIFTDDKSILANTIATKWVFNIKSDGRYKARLVARGDRQSESTYDEVYSPTLRPEIARSIFSLAVNRKWFLNQYDFTTAYLNSILTTPFYIYPPAGYETSKSQGGKRVVYKLNRGLYGLKQAGRLWHQTLSETLTNIGFSQSSAFPSTFVLRKGKRTIAVLGVFVDDMIFTAESQTTIDDTIRKLKEKYSLKESQRNDDGKNRFLGIDVIVNRNKFKQVDEIILSQEDYISNFAGE